MESPTLIAHTSKDRFAFSSEVLSFNVISQFPTDSMAVSSSVGMVIGFKGFSLDFPMMKEQ